VKGEKDIVNRFGLETEDSGNISIRLNLASQNQIFKRSQRKQHHIVKEKEKLEIRKRIHNQKLDQIKNEDEKMRMIHNPESEIIQDEQRDPNLIQ
jgi:hypothetical protein